MTDLKAAFRSLRSTPLVSAVAILSLALGIGANTAIFSIVDALILRSLPVANAERLAIVRQGEQRASWTNPIWEEIRARQHDLRACRVSCEQYGVARSFVDGCDHRIVVDLRPRCEPPHTVLEDARRHAAVRCLGIRDDVAVQQ